MANQQMPVDKPSFLFGLVAGIAILSVATLIFVSISNNSNGEVAGEKIAQEDSGVENNNADNNEPLVYDIEVTENDHIRGKFDAPTTVVEFSDFYCPYCSRFHETMKQVIETYPDKVRWVYKHFPLDSLHPNARQAAAASECANDQGKFWEYADELYTQQATMNNDSYLKIAENLGLDTKAFASCLSSEKYAEKVNNDFILGTKNNVQGTPGSFINGQAIPGAVPFEQMKSIIESL